MIISFKIWTLNSISKVSCSFSLHHLCPPSHLVSLTCISLFLIPVNNRYVAFAFVVSSFQSCLSPSLTVCRIVVISPSHKWSTPEATCVSYSSDNTHAITYIRTSLFLPLSFLVLEGWKMLESGWGMGIVTFSSCKSNLMITLLSADVCLEHLFLSLNTHSRMRENELVSFRLPDRLGRVWREWDRAKWRVEVESLFLCLRKFTRSERQQIIHFQILPDAFSCV